MIFVEKPIKVTVKLLDSITYKHDLYYPTLVTYGAECGANGFGQIVLVKVMSHRADSVKRLEGTLDASPYSFGVVVAHFNHLITGQLLDGALDTLMQHGANQSHIHVVRVPGCFEIPLACKKLASTGKYDAVIALGAVIRGATTHFDHVAGGVSGGVARASLDTGVPVILGVITPDSLEQAFERAGSKAGNKGSEAASAAIEMASVVRQVEEL